MRNIIISKDALKIYYRRKLKFFYDSIKQLVWNKAITNESYKNYCGIKATTSLQSYGAETFMMKKENRAGRNFTR